MASPLQPVRGTRDILGDDAIRHHHVVETARKITALYGFAEWQTPIFEDTNLFLRPLGETSDVVTKEMYTFEDRGGESITLRPEGTAGICRALITAGLTQTLPQKAFYAGPMFRYERPQKGRYRQFHQIGVELLGPSAPLADAEVIACGWHILTALGITQNVELRINTLGDLDSRANYRAALVAYFSAYADKLSADSKTRLEKNPLRILDSKDQGDRELLANAPLIYDHLTADAAIFYNGLKTHLSALQVPFVEDPAIVRGFDYYNHTAFEFVTNALGAQGTVMGGGRYNGLVEQLGGPNVPGIGWGAGIERLAMLIAPPARVAANIAVIAEKDEISQAQAVRVAALLRGRGVGVEIAFSPGFKNGLKFANRIGAGWAILVNGEALALKNLEDGAQADVTAHDLVERFTK
jgi:histidyl-tRNA synthetase